MERTRRYWIWTSKATLTDVAAPAAPKRTGSRSGPQAWWTCSPETNAGDIAFVYRPESGRTADDPAVGITHVVEALGQPIDISHDPYAAGLGWSTGCRYQVLAALKRPVGLAALREMGAVTAGSIGILRAFNALSQEHGDGLLEQIRRQGQKIRMPDRLEIGGEYRRELDLQAEILAESNLPVVLRSLGVRVPKEVRLIDTDGHRANVRAEARVEDHGRRRRADIVVDEDGLFGRRVVIELKNTAASPPDLTQVLDYCREIERSGLRKPKAILVTQGFSEQMRSAARKAGVQIATIDELGLPSAAASRAVDG